MLIMPHSKEGRWSVIWALLMPGLFCLGSFLARGWYRGIPAGNSLKEDFLKRPLLVLTMLSGMLAGVLAFAIGLRAIVKQKERNLLVWLATFSGALLIFFLLGQTGFFSLFQKEWGI